MHKRRQINNPRQCAEMEIDEPFGGLVRAAQRDVQGYYVAELKQSRIL